MKIKILSQSSSGEFKIEEKEGHLFKDTYYYYLLPDGVACLIDTETGRSIFKSYVKDLEDIWNKQFKERTERLKRTTIYPRLREQFKELVIKYTGESVSSLRTAKNEVKSKVKKKKLF